MSKAIVRAITALELESLINEEGILFVDFWAPWCAPCKQFSDIYERVASLHEGVVFATINIAEEQECADAFNIQSIPHLMVCKQGIVIYSEAGSMPQSTLSDLVQQALVADVTGIRAQLEREEAK